MILNVPRCSLWSSATSISDSIFLFKNHADNNYSTVSFSPHHFIVFFLTSLVEFHSSIVFLGARKLVSSKHFCNGDSTIGVIIVSVHSISDAEKKKLCLGERSILSSFFFFLSINCFQWEQSCWGKCIVSTMLKQTIFNRNCPKSYWQTLRPTTTTKQNKGEGLPLKKNC